MLAAFLVALPFLLLALAGLAAETPAIVDAIRKDRQ